MRGKILAKMNGTECPKCGSKDAQMVQVFISMNTTVGRTQSAGVGYSRNVGLFVGAGGSASVSESAFVTSIKHLDPGREPAQPSAPLAYLAVPVTLWVGFEVLVTPGAWQDLWPIAFCSALLILNLRLVVNVRSYPKRIAAWREKKRLWEDGWLCLRCGSVWLPRDAGVGQAASGRRVGDQPPAASQNQIAGSACTHCGQSVPQQAVFCMYCGATLARQTAPPIAGASTSDKHGKSLVGSAGSDPRRRPPRSGVLTIVGLGVGAGLLFCIYVATVKEHENRAADSEPAGQTAHNDQPAWQPSPSQGGRTSAIQSSVQASKNPVSPESKALVPPSGPDKSTGAAADVPAGILEVLERWRESMLSGNLDVQADCYAPMVEVFFRRRNLDSATLRDIKRALMAVYPNVKAYQLSDLTLETGTDERAAVTFRKKWDARDASGLKQFSGEERQRLTFVKLESDWKIVREEELQVYWVRKK